MPCQVIGVEYHRNGVGNNGYHTVLFIDSGQGTMIGIVFDEPLNTAVLHVDSLYQGHIDTLKNGYPAGEYEEFLETCIANYKLTQKT